MLVTKYIVVMNHSGNDRTYYYRGQDKSGYNYFGLLKSQAQRFDIKEEAIRAMNILRAINLCDTDTFFVESTTCRM